MNIIVPHLGHYCGSCLSSVGMDFSLKAQIPCCPVSFSAWLAYSSLQNCLICLDFLTDIAHFIKSFSMLLCVLALSYICNVDSCLHIELETHKNALGWYDSLFVSTQYALSYAGLIYRPHNLFIGLLDLFNVILMLRTDAQPLSCRYIVTRWPALHSGTGGGGTARIIICSSHMGYINNMHTAY